MKYKTSVFLLAALFFYTSTAYSQIKNIIVEPSGEHAEIGLTEQNILAKQLKGGNSVEQAAAVEYILSNPNQVIPPILCKLSEVLLDASRKEEAVYWYYLGLLRARYDANRCNDKSARQAVGILKMNFAERIIEYGNQDLENFKIKTDSVLKFVETNDEKYDHRWINLHGMGAFLNDKKELSKPESEWPKIRKETIETFKIGFRKFIENVSERKKIPDSVFINRKDSLEKEMSYVKVSWFLEEVKSGKSHLPLVKLEDANLKKSWKTDPKLSKYHNIFQKSLSNLHKFQKKHSPEFEELSQKLRRKEIQRSAFFKARRGLVEKLKRDHPDTYPDLLENRLEGIKNLWYESGVFLLEKHKANNQVFPTDWLADQEIASFKLGMDYMKMKRKLESTVVELDRRGVN